MNRRFLVLTVVVAAGAIFAANPASAQTKLLRFPDISGDHVVFCYGGDLWRASTSGGVATRLTAHPGQEIFPCLHGDKDGLVSSSVSVMGKAGKQVEMCG